MDLTLNSTTWDLDVSSGDLSLIQNQDCVVQYLRQKLKHIQGEWFLDESVGVPYFDYIFVKNPNIGLVDSIIKQEVLNTPGIVEITSFDLSLDTARRQLQISFTGRGKTGIIEFTDKVGA